MLQERMCSRLRGNASHLFPDHAKLPKPCGDVFAEGNCEAVGSHGSQSHLRILQLLNQLCRLARLQQRNSDKQSHA